MNSITQFISTSNARALPFSAVPEMSITSLVEAAWQRTASGDRLCAWFGLPEPSGTRVICVLANDAENTLLVAKSHPVTHGYPSLTRYCAEAHLFERELWEQHQLLPEGHPWLKPVREGQLLAPRMGDFFEVAGSEIHEVAVGPVHAGIIEPGHFRFQCAGEEVLHLEIALGYQQRGVEAALQNGPHRNALVQIETVAGDSTIAHATAYSLLLESLAGVEAPLQAQWLRAIALELERLANHTGDLGALANDVAFLPTSAACGKLRGDFLNLTALICGNRFGRSLIRPGGCRLSLEPDRRDRLATTLAPIRAEVDRAAEWLWDASSVRSRFEGVGALSSELATQIGLVGPAARASGLVRDVRYDHPTGWHRFAQIPVAVWPGGDVFARARVRWLEIQRSGEFIAEQINDPPDGPPQTELPQLAADSLVISLIEAWRGEVCHIALTDAHGRFRRYKIVDPSFHNWTGLAMALRGQAISDFPLCNKSFNLSYCGFDL